MNDTNYFFLKHHSPIANRFFKFLISKKTNNNEITIDGKEIACNNLIPIFRNHKSNKKNNFYVIDFLKNKGFISHFEYYKNKYELVYYKIIITDKFLNYVN